MPSAIYQLRGGGGLSFPVGVETPDAYVQVYRASQSIPIVEAALWTPGGAATELYLVNVRIVNSNNTLPAAWVSIGVDVAAGGALAVPEYWLDHWVVPYPGETDWIGEHQVRGNDTVRAVASVLNLQVHWRIRRVI